MKAAILFFGVAAFVAVTKGSEPTRESVFDSVDRFMTTVKAFQPAATKGTLASLFTIPEMGGGLRTFCVSRQSEKTQESQQS